MLFRLNSDCMNSVKNEKVITQIESDFWKSQKLMPSKKSQFSPIAKINSHKTKKETLIRKVIQSMTNSPSISQNLNSKVIYYH